MIKINFIPNVLEKKGRFSKSYKLTPGISIGQYVEGFCNEKQIRTKELNVIVRGVVVKDLSAPARDNDEIIVTPKVRAPIVAAVAAIGSWVGAHIALTISLALTAYSVFQAVTAGRPKSPSFGSLSVDGSLDQSSPTYGWDGIQSTQDVGIPIRILYGEHRIGGNIINQYVRTDGDKQYLNILFGLCEGEIEDIDSLYINDNPAANFSGITQTERLGTNDQSVIPNFQDQHSVFNLNAHLVKDAAYTYTTIATDVEAFEIELNLPGGIFQVDGNGSVTSWAVDYLVEYRVHGGGDYTSLGTTTISEKSKTAVKRVFRKVGLSPAQYDIRITRTSDDPSLSPQKEGDLYLASVDEITTEDLAYPNLAIVGVEALATDQLSGGTPNFTWLVKGRKVRVPEVIYAAAPVDWEDYYWDPDAEAYKLISTGATCTWDGTTYVNAYSANPVWCLRDLLTNTRYGLGEYIDTTEIDDDSFLEMSRYCEELVSDGMGGHEKRFRLDVSIDSLTNALDVITQLTATFRAFAFFSAGTIKFKIDKPDTPVQIFGMGNIVRSSFLQNWKSKKEIPNVVEVEFTDKDKNYQQEIVSVIDEDALTDGEQLRKKQTRIFCTRISQALREGRFAVNVGKYVNRFVQLRAGIEAVVCQTGDLISISHDVPQIGESGRVAAGSTTTLVKLDRTIVLNGALTYKIQVRFADDTIEERTIVGTSGSVTQVSVTSAFSQTPAAFDVYAVGLVNVVTKPFRVISIKRENNFEVEITAIEYNEDVYDTDSIVIPQTNYSQLSRATPYVTDLELTERDSRLSDGRIEIAIDVDFVKPELTAYSIMAYRRAKIYISDDEGASWRLVGDTTSNSFSINAGLAKDVSYMVAVTSVSVDGTETAVALSPQETIVVHGKQLLPSDVETFLVNQSRDSMVFGWDEVNDEDLYGYEIRRGSTWASGVVVATGIRHTNTFRLDSLEGADQSFWIKAMDTSGNYSETATEAVVTIETIPFQNIIQSYEESPDWAGTLSNAVIEEDGGLLVLEPDPDAAFDTLPGETFDSDPLRRFAGVPGLTGTYTTPVRDVGFRAPFKIVIDAIAVASDTGAAFDSDPEATFDSDPLRRFSGYEIAGALSFEIRTSDDNVTWTDWAAYQVGDYNCRYFQLRMTMTNSDASIQMVVPYFNYYADLPDVDEYGIDGNVAVAGDGEVVTFQKTFHQTPAILVSILSGSGIYYQLSDVDTTGFTIKLYNAAGAAQTGTYAFHAHGI